MVFILVYSLFHSDSDMGIREYGKQCITIIAWFMY